MESFNWKLAHAPARFDVGFIAVDNWRTYNAVAPKAVPTLLRYGIKRFDRRTLLE